MLESGFPSGVEYVGTLIPDMLRKAQSQPHPHSPGTRALGLKGSRGLMVGSQTLNRPESSALAGNHCSGTIAVIKERKANLQKEGESWKVREQEAPRNFLDILLFARVSVGRERLSLWAEAHRKAYLHSGPASTDGE